MHISKYFTILQEVWSQRRLWRSPFVSKQTNTRKKSDLAFAILFQFLFPHPLRQYHVVFPKRNEIGPRSKLFSNYSGKYSVYAPLVGYRQKSSNGTYSGEIVLQGSDIREEKSTRMEGSGQ